MRDVYQCQDILVQILDIGLVRLVVECRYDLALLVVTLIGRILTRPSECGHVEDAQAQSVRVGCAVEIALDQILVPRSRDFGIGVEAPYGQDLGAADSMARVSETGGGGGVFNL